MNIIPEYPVHARLILSRHNGILDLDTWDSELTDYRPGVRAVREWFRDHLTNAYTIEDLFALLHLPSDNDVFEVVFEGELSGWCDEWSGEWEENLDIIDCEFQPVP